ncbi:MAG: hypothetical protein CR982_02470 [Candidatus Cloacimonadota bacterium]|nr:MAG: hypothetical protein CR982_02470 [Candidatus Cloacimonadota bacterium]PIE78556.1 MAG: hypothetical protein CSA15_07510 [Candidatus Delongbacteria bacterium]
MKTTKSFVIRKERGMKVITVFLLFTLTLLHSEKSITLDYKKVSSIVGDEDKGSMVYDLSYFNIDKLGNIYIVDGKEKNIKVFDSSGKFLFKFGSEGQGPGEFIVPQSIVITATNIFVADQMGMNISKFDLKGNFIESLPAETGVPSSIRNLGNDTLLGLDAGSDQKDGKFFVVGSLRIYDSNMKEKKVVDKFSALLDLKNPQLNPMDLLPAFCGNENSLYYGLIDENRYNIKKLDLASGEDALIKRRYRKVKISSEEIKRRKKSVTVSVQSDRGGGSVTNEIKEKYHKAIQSMWLDKYENLLVMPADQLYTDKVELDLFKGDKFIGKLDFSAFEVERGRGSSEHIKFCNDKLYIGREDEDGYPIIDIYEYSYDIK